MPGIGVSLQSCIAFLYMKIHGSTHGRIWPKSQYKCAGSWVLYPYQNVRVKIVKNCCFFTFNTPSLLASDCFGTFGTSLFGGGGEGLKVHPWWWNDFSFSVAPVFHLTHGDALAHGSSLPSFLVHQSSHTFSFWPNVNRPFPKYSSG